MKVGLILPIADEGGGTPAYADVRSVALAAETAGLDSLWVFDHLLFRFGGETTGIHECWTVLAALAEATSRAALGTLVMCTGFRNAALLAKMAATLDHVCGGRLVLGVGAGWHDPEYEAFGYPTDHRVGRFEEALRVISSLVRTGAADLDGTYEHVRDAVLLPPARADLPILVAGGGPRMIELTARHADAWNTAWYGLPDERLAGKRAELDAACTRVGRERSAIELTVGVSVRASDAPDDADGPALEGTPAAVAAGLAAHAQAGVDHVILSVEPASPAGLAATLAGFTAFRAASA